MTEGKNDGPGIDLLHPTEPLVPLLNGKKRGLVRRKIDLLPSKQDFQDGFTKTQEIAKAVNSPKMAPKE